MATALTTKQARKNSSSLPVQKVNLFYGSIATVVVVLLFLEVSFIILLLGAQVIAELEASAAAGLPWHVKPASPMASTLSPSVAESPSFQAR